MARVRSPLAAVSAVAARASTVSSSGEACVPIACTVSTAITIALALCTPVYDSYVRSRLAWLNWRSSSELGVKYLNMNLNRITGYVISGLRVWVCRAALHAARLCGLCSVAGVSALFWGCGRGAKAEAILIHFYINIFNREILRPLRWAFAFTTLSCKK